MKSNINWFNNYSSNFYNLKENRQRTYILNAQKLKQSKYF